MKWLLIFGLVLVHDGHHPELDQWYQNLRMSNGLSCCNVTDCHPTEAELRADGHWWARLGDPIDPLKGPRDWILGPYVQVPDDTIVRDAYGHVIPNPTGEPVICHMTAHNAFGQPAWASEFVRCFVPGIES